MLLNFFFYLMIFVFGLAVGSFLNCVIYRLQENENFFWGRSFCPHCKHVLSWKDLFPLFSFLTLKGKCRYCQKPISWQYPLVEIATALLFVLIFNFQQFGPELTTGGLSAFNLENLLITCYLLLITSLLIIIFVYDLKHYLIPDEIIYSAISIALIYNFFDIQHLIGNTGRAALGAGAFFSLMYLISKGKWLGFGDVKLAFFMGLFLGFPNILVALFLAFFIGAIVGLGLIAINKKTFKSEVPFAPFLVTGTFLAMFLGKEFINWYFNLIF